MELDAEGPNPANNTVADLDSDPGEMRSHSSVGRYVILDSIGMGGMGLVCAAYDPKLNRKIALKLLRNASSDEASTSGRNRLFREAQALAKLSHPNVVTVHDVDVFEGQVYIAMEFVEGTTLREWLRGGTRTWQEILEKFVLAGRGLEAAHAADIIHRDFKPANVLISNDGDVRVADFGVAKEHDRSLRDRERERLEFERRRRTVTAAEGVDTTTAEHALIEEIQSNADLELTTAGRMVGTPAYMAPEQHMGLRVGPFTDQYAFCVSLYEALYGRLPFEAGDRREQLAKMTEGRLPPPPRDGAVRNVPGWLHRVIARGLSPHPSDRWSSMTELLAALSRDPIRRLRRLAILGVGVCGLIAGALGLALGQDEPDLCAGVGEEVYEEWNDARREQLGAAFAKSGKPLADDAARRVTATLDGWTEAWHEQREQTCRATRLGEQSELLLDVRMDCLDQALQDFVALVEVFAEADDDIVERSVAAAHGLRQPRLCADVKRSDETPLRELDPETQEKILAMDRDLDRARALALLSKFDDSLPLQARVVERARKLEERQTLMQALFDLSESQSENGEKAGCEASLREAIELAAELGDAEQEARAWARMVHLVGYEQDRALEGRAWAFAARGAIVRAGNPAELWVRYDSAFAAVLYADGKYAEALERYRSGLERAREAFGEDDPQTLKLMVNTGSALGALERYDEAKTVLREAASRFKEVYGPAHPQLASVYLNLGTAYTLGGEPDKAEQALREALAIRERAFDPDAPQVAHVLQALANVTVAERPAEALADFERAAEIFAANEGEHSSELAVALTNVGRARQDLGQLEQAREAYDQALAIYDQLHPEPHPKRVSLQDRRCGLFVAASLWTEAAEACEVGLAEGARVGARSKLLLSMLDKLATAEQARGHKSAAERARAEAARRRGAEKAEKPDEKPEK